jgi:hypothetical protein
VQRLYRRRSYSPAKVARAIVDACATNPGVLPVTPESWAMWLAERVSPGLVARLGRTERVIAKRREAMS